MIMINVALDFMGAAVMITLLLGGLLIGQRQNRSGRLFLLLLTLTLLQLLADMVNWLCEGKPEVRTLLYLANYIIFFAAPIMALVFYHYTLTLTNQKTAPLVTGAVNLLCVVWLLFNVWNIFSHMFFFVAGDGTYQRGEWYLLYHLYHLSVILLAAGNALRARGLGWGKKLSIVSYAALPLLALLFQLFYYGLSSLTYCALTLSMLLIYIAVHLDHVESLQKTRIAYQLTLADAETDDLTGLYNRKPFARETEKGMADNAGEGYALVMMDLDQFKKVNDTLGHAAGDQVLVEFAEKLRNIFGETTPITRFGGDEFCIFLRGITLEELYALLRHSRKELSITAGSGESAICARASIGAAYVHKNVSAAYQKVFDLADKALYTSKGNGGAQYTVSEIKN